MLPERVAFYLSLALIFTGLALIVLGVLLVVDEGVKVYYHYADLAIPAYRFETLIPGNYTETVARWLEMIRVENITKPAEFTYIVEPPPDNCSGGSSINLALLAYATSKNITPSILVEIYGCRGEVCTPLYVQDIFKSREGCSYDSPTFGCKVQVRLPRSVLEYDRFEFKVAPTPGLTIHLLSAGTELTCTHSYTLEYPVVKPIPEPRYIHLHIPTYVDTSGLITGLALSLIGLVLMILGVYTKLFSTKV
jgi:uncharacterized membrane protein